MVLMTVLEIPCNWFLTGISTFGLENYLELCDSDFLFTFNVYHMDDKDESDLVMVLNDSNCLNHSFLILRVLFLSQGCFNFGIGFTFLN
jgi:hypothetical protein